MDNLEIEKIYIGMDNICQICQKVYDSSIINNLKYKDHCFEHQKEAEENKINLLNILNNANMEIEEKKEFCSDCDNDKCIYINKENKLYNIGLYEFCPDCYFAIGRHVAKNGFY